MSFPCFGAVYLPVEKTIFITVHPLIALRDIQVMLQERITQGVWIGVRPEVEGL